jgi:hypothetical protein
MTPGSGRLLDSSRLSSRSRKNPSRISEICPLIKSHGPSARA